MSWAVSPFPPKEPLAAKHLMLALGKALHLACEFERKCQYLCRMLNLAATFKAAGDDIKGGDIGAIFAAAAAKKDEALWRSIDRMAKTKFVNASDISDLMKAQKARNYVAHESGEVGPLDYINKKALAEALASLRPKVVDLARGDNVISCWQFELTEKQGAPEWITESYEGRVLSWIFGEPFNGCFTQDEWVVGHLAQRPP